MALPLEGILVVAVEQAAAAPYASSRLADAGARVIKVERAQGDFARGYDSAVNGDSTYFVWLNRGKESIVLDFSNADDAALLQRLIGQADVLIQNLGPGAAKRAGFGWEAMRARHPRLITCDITGYGEEGPYAGMRAYDLLVQAESGIASVTGTPEAPGRIGVSACDVATGMYAHAAILEALLQRERTGAGSAIHVSLFDAMCDWMTVPLLHYEYAGMIWPRVGLSHPTIAPYGAFPVGGAVGAEETVLIGVQNDGEWKRFAEDVLKRADLTARPEFATNLARVEHRAQLDREIAATLATMTKQQVVSALAAARIAFASVNDVTQLSRHPQLRRTTVPTAHGEARLVSPPATFRGQERKLGEVPGLGQHSSAIRAEFAK
ncbi:crotonobetainyl-CoA:carnitine CoA-transferase CaiB-like acyl-CoA transferase [Cupriavidus gilardii J11]|uniref:Crotonobetainyl-CoA:carnitine CoA-transferase CaiB-like acyl-CoA transferase n=1 Tax=Cupriavidus gilardii J11 TaxID=936133 RepID=A0A562BKE1_9BURK|nr:CaiB/BaiF CoA-transferase family protein [Cupriavidus gilardii]TWG85616.1 crotonobetainyl-CoA:carnitine CoA-transferase CaiB-like acyl-CoA transferase [Cupriavidus gilardii J11]